MKTLLFLRLNVIVPLIGSLVNFILGIFVLSRDSNNEVNQSFCYLAITLAIWNFKALMMQFAPSAAVAMTSIKLFHPGTVFTFSVFFHFILALTGDHRKSSRNLLSLGYLISFLLLVNVWSDWPVPVIKGVDYLYDGYFPVVDRGHNVVFLGCFVFFFTYGSYLLVQRYRHPLDVLEKNRIGLVFVGSAIGFLGGIPNFFLAGQLTRVYPTGYVASMVFGLFVTYAIIKYQLMDVEIVIRKGTIYTLTTAFLTGSFLTGLAVIQFLLEKVIGSSSRIPTILAIWLVAFLFQPIRVAIQHLIDSTFYRQRIDFQEVISEFSELIVSIIDREELADSAVAILGRTFHAESVSIMLLRRAGNKEKYFMEAIAGLDRESLEGVVLEQNDSFVEYLKDTKNWVLREALLPQFYPNAGPVEEAIVTSMDKVNSAISFPLFWGGEKMVGILNLGKKQSTTIYNAEEINLLTILCHEAAVAFENANLYDEAKRHLASAVEALAAVVEAKDSYTFGHCHRVINHAVAIGRKLSLPNDKVEALRLGAALHDVGKIGINKAILTKPDKLTETEYAVICTHAEIGAGILRPLNLSKDVIDSVKYHHERFDGKGYPYKLCGEEIPLVARIVSVADVYEALTSDRVYRLALKKEVALHIIREQKGRQFDPKVVDVFLSIIN